MVYKYNHFTELNRIQREIIESLGNDFWQDSAEGTYFPPIDIYEIKDTITIMAAIPGLKNTRDIEISISNNILRIKGKLERTFHFDNLIQNEIYTGNFDRKVELPAVSTANIGEAVYKNGLLTIVLTKTFCDSKKKINIRWCE